MFTILQTTFFIHFIIHGTNLWLHSRWLLLYQIQRISNILASHLHNFSASCCPSPSCNIPWGLRRAMRFDRIRIRCTCNQQIWITYGIYQNIKRVSSWHQYIVVHLDHDAENQFMAKNIDITFLALMINTCQSRGTECQIANAQLTFSSHWIGPVCQSNLCNLYSAIFRGNTSVIRQMNSICEWCYCDFKHS